MAVVVLAAAVVLAIIANVIVFLIVTGPLGEPMLMCNCDLEPPTLESMSVVDPILFSTIFGIGAVVVYSIVSYFSARPLRVFALMALVVLLASLMLPMRMPSPPVESSAKLALVSMHVVGYLVILGTLWFGHRRGWLTSQKGRSDSTRP